MHTMLLRSFTNVKCMRISARQKAFINADLDCIHRTFSVLTNKLSEKTNNDIHCKSNLIVRERSLLRILLFSSSANNDSKSTNVKTTNTKDQIDLKDKSNLNKSEIEVLKKLQQGQVDNIHVIKELEIKSSGKKLIVEATADADSKINTLILKKPPKASIPHEPPQG